PISPESFTQEQRSKWLETGETPAPTKTEAPAPSTESEDENPKPAEADAAKPNDTQPEHKKRGGESRKQELAAEIQDMLAERARVKRELEEDQRKLDQSKQGAKTDPPAVADKPSAEAPKRPKIDDFETYEEFDAAQDKYFSDLADFKAREAVKADRETREKAEAERKEQEAKSKEVQNWQEKVTKARSKHADFDKVAFDAQIPISDAMKKFFLQSPDGADLLYDLGSNISEAQRIFSLSEFETNRELTKLELAIPSKTPKPKTVTQSNPPPKEVGGFAKTGDDAVAAALESGDTRAYIDEANRRDAARLQRK
ncbi:MAG: hypothetical protein WC378_15260, partial [Opitutaceae bacterium]